MNLSVGLLTLLAVVSSTESQHHHADKTLVAFAQAYSVIRYFHGSDLSREVDWHRFLAHHVPRARTHEGDAAAFLNEAFAAVAPTAVFCRDEVADACGAHDVERGVDYAVLSYRGLPSEFGNAYSVGRLVGGSTDPLIQQAMVPFYTRTGETVLRIPVAVPVSADGSTTDSTSNSLQARARLDKAMERVDPGELSPANRGRAALIEAWAAMRHFYVPNQGPEVDWEDVLEKGLASAAEVEHPRGAVTPLQILVGRAGAAGAWIEDQRFLYNPRCFYDPEFSLARDEEGLFVLHSFNRRIRPGDRLLAIDGNPIGETLAPWAGELQQFPWMASGWFIRQINAGRSRYDNASVVVTFERNGKTRRRSIPLGDRLVGYANVVRWLADRVLYIDATSHAQWDFIETKLSLMSQADAVVIDVRGGGAPDLQELLHHLPVAGTSTSFRYVLPQRVRPGAPPLPHPGSDWHDFKPKQPVIETRLIFVTNHQTHGQAERIIAELRERQKIRVVGERTAGALAYSTVVELPDAMRISFNVAPFITRAGLNHERIGIVPDLVVPTTRKAALDGIDEQLTAARDLALRQ